MKKTGFVNAGFVDSGFVDSGFLDAGYSLMLASDELIKIDRVSLVKISCENVGGSFSINIDS